MKINPFIFRSYDIRGIVDEDLDLEKVEAIAKSYGTFLRRRRIRQTVVGRDCRLSGAGHIQTTQAVVAGADDDAPLHRGFGWIILCLSDASSDCYFAMLLGGR